jgi:hypothetical protein
LLHHRVPGTNHASIVHCHALRLPSLIRQHVCTVAPCHASCSFIVFLMRGSHSISSARAQCIPKYKLGLGGAKDGRVGERLVEGGRGGGTT